MVVQQRVLVHIDCRQRFDVELSSLGSHAVCQRRHIAWLLLLLRLGCVLGVHFGKHLWLHEQTVDTVLEPDKLVLVVALVVLHCLRVQIHQSVHVGDGEVAFFDRKLVLHDLLSKVVGQRLAFDEYLLSVSSTWAVVAARRVVSGCCDPEES